MADKKISALTAATTPLAGTEVLPIVQSASTVKVAVNDMLGVTSWTSPAVNSEGNMFLRATDTLATGVGTQIGLGGKYNASSYFPFAAVAGRKENATNNNVAGYLAFLTTTSGGTLTERARIDSTGNLVISTAGNGIDFSANTHAAGMTSELLNDYEEGTWTPVVRGSGAAGTYELASSAAYYTAIGRLVTLHMTLTTAGSVTGGGTGYLQITGVPFANAAFATGTVYLQGVDFTADYVVCNFTSASGSSILYFEEVRDAASSGDLPVSAIATNDTIRLTIQYIR